MNAKVNTKVKMARGGADIAVRCSIANSFLTRARGLLGKKVFVSGEGLLLTRCNNIHMWFMRFPIDVLFLTQKGPSYCVSSLHQGVAPWRLAPLWDLKAQDTL